MVGVIVETIDRWLTTAI